MSKSKRLLSLVLALLMTIALFTGGAIATNENGTDETATDAAADNSPIGDFTDVTWANQYAEAIAVLVAAGITNGDGDATTFNPKGNLTRAMAATFMARIALTKKNADLLLKSETGFKDVGADHWASGEIAWARANGVIAGYPSATDDTYTFEPDGNLTGVQILRMLLGVLNVDKVTELTGDMWATNTMSYAIRLGLLENIFMDDYNSNVTREQMAQLILNAMCASGYTDVQQIGNDLVTLGGVWVQGANPLYVRNGLSRRQTENTDATDDGTFAPDAAKRGTRVTPYGLLFYRWQMAETGMGITSWKWDTKNERPVVDPIIADPTTTGGLPLGLLRNVFKVFVNGAVTSTNPNNNFTLIGWDTSNPTIGGLVGLTTAQEADAWRYYSMGDGY